MTTVSKKKRRFPAQAIRAGLVDEYQVFVAPIIVGGGKAFLPDNVRVTLELLEERGFRHGMVHLRYRAKSSSRG